MKIVSKVLSLPLWLCALLGWLLWLFRWENSQGLVQFEHMVAWGILLILIQTGERN